MEKVTGRSSTISLLAVNATSWIIGQWGAAMTATVRERPSAPTTR